MHVCGGMLETEVIEGIQPKTTQMLCEVSWFTNTDIFAGFQKIAVLKLFDDSVREPEFYPVNLISPFVFGVFWVLCTGGSLPDILPKVDFVDLTNINCL